MAPRKKKTKKNNNEKKKRSKLEGVYLNDDEKYSHFLVRIFLPFHASFITIKMNMYLHLRPSGHQMFILWLE